MRFRRLCGVLTAALAVTLVVSGGSAQAATSTKVIKDTTTGYLLDVYGASTRAGDSVTTWTANGGANQAWVFTQRGGTVDNPVWTIKNVNSGLYLALANCQTGAVVPNGAYVVQEPESTTNVPPQAVWIGSWTDANKTAIVIQNGCGGYLTASRGKGLATITQPRGKCPDTYLGWSAFANCDQVWALP